MAVAGEDWQRLGDYVRNRRKELGLSRAEFATIIGVSYRTAGQVERGIPVARDTIASTENALGWKPGSARRILEGGEPELVPGSPGSQEQDADPRPKLVRDSWDDPQVQQLWELRHIPADAKAGLISDYLQAREREAEIAGVTELRRGRPAR